MNLFGDRVREARKAKKMTQYELSELATISQVTVSVIENSHNGTYVDTAIKIAKVLDVSLDWLLLGKGKKCP